MLKRICGVTASLAFSALSFYSLRQTVVHRFEMHQYLRGYFGEFTTEELMRLSLIGSCILILAGFVGVINFAFPTEKKN